MTLTKETLQFIRLHRTDDVRSLALQAGRHPGVDMPAAVTQIAGWQAARTKIPTWAATDGILYPPHLSMEQCSSELTADYKAAIVAQAGGERHSLTDLTGGFGIDFSALAAEFERADYVERQEILCELARHNFPLLGLKHATFHQADATEYLQGMDPVSWLFLDPARGDYRVAPGSPALAVGFRNFCTESFGVRCPRLRRLAKTPLLPALGQPHDASAATSARRTEWLGARLKEVRGSELSAFGAAFDQAGLVVESVDPGTPTHRAGLRTGDLILRVDGVRTDCVRALTDHLAATRARTRRVDLLRNQEPLTLDMKE